ncbi:MAG: amidohydrolase family protein [Acidimicrobiales bacterium]
MAETGMTSGAPTVALCGGTVVAALDPPVVRTCDVVLAGDRVLSLGTAPVGVPRRDCSGMLIVPGNVCAHHHLYSALSRGMPYGLAPPTNFLEILQRVWWRLDRALDESSVRASALRGGLDALLAGTTTIVDHHASPNFIDGSLDVIAETLGELGVRAVLCYEVTDRDGPERALAGIRENSRFSVRPRPLARGMVGAHASFTLSDESLAGCVEAARSAGVGVHIHVAEDDADERDCQERFGVRVVERLADAGAVTERALLSHCVHVTDAEAVAIESAGATVVCNPRSNMNNGVGHSPFNHRGGKVALGTDGIGGDMLAESQTGFFRAKEADALVSQSWPLERMAEGARLAGRVFGEPLLGTLAPGAPADLCVLAYPVPAPLHCDNLAGHWVFGLAPGRVRDVYVAGELVVAEGRSTRVDEAMVAASGVRITEQLWRRLEGIPPHQYELNRRDHR